MKKLRQFLLFFAGLFLVLPGVIMFLFQKNTRQLLDGEENLEWYLPGMLYEVTTPEMDTETLKAQAVIMRSNLNRSLADGEAAYDEIREKYSVIGRKQETASKDFYHRLVNACEKTKGEVVTYEGEICYCPFFYASNGTTREAFSFFEDGSYPYLIAKPSHRDEESSAYLSYHHFSMEEFSQAMNELSEFTFENQIEVIERDQSDYITWIKVGDAMVGGEVFRNRLGLSSACFSIEQKDEGIRITCKGRGHGFGFSQYGANAMAVDGKDYKELLSYYFHNIEIENMYRFS